MEEMKMNTDKLYAEQLANEYAPKDTSKVVAVSYTHLDVYKRQSRRWL